MNPVRSKTRMLLLALAISAPVFADGVVGPVHIKSILSSSGKIDVQLESAVADPSNTGTTSAKARWSLPEDSPYYRRILATLLAAKASGDPIMWWDCGAVAGGWHPACDIVEGEVWP